MTRVVLGSKHTSSGSSAVQFFTTGSPKLTQITFRPRSGNSTFAYITTSSGATSTNGYAFSSGADSLYGYERVLTVTATVKATTFWMRCADTTAVVDFKAVFED